MMGNQDDRQDQFFYNFRLEDHCTAPGFSEAQFFERIES